MRIIGLKFCVNNWKTWAIIHIFELINPLNYKYNSQEEYQYELTTWAIIIAESLNTLI